MQSLKSKIILGLIRNRHLFQFQLKRKPFDCSFEGIKKLRETTEKAGNLFGKVPKEIEITPVEIGKMYAEWLKIKELDNAKAMLYFHGGMYILGSPQSHRIHVRKFVQGARINALVFDYRLAPENPFPAALDDAILAFQYLLNQGFKPTDIVFAGDSAGGGLCLATLLAIKDKGLPLPAAAAVLSPWTDLMLTGFSYKSNAKKCLSPEGSAENCSRMYAGTHELNNPLISPLYGHLSGLPPLHISAGSNEILLDDSVLFAIKAKKAGVNVTLKIGEGMCHCYPAFSGIFPEASETFKEICGHLARNCHV